MICCHWAYSTKCQSREMGSESYYQILLSCRHHYHHNIKHLKSN